MHILLSSRRRDANESGRKWKKFALLWPTGSALIESLVLSLVSACACAGAGAAAARAPLTESGYNLKLAKSFIFIRKRALRVRARLVLKVSWSASGSVA